MAEKLLSDARVRNAKASAKERLLADGSGLYLRIRGQGKDWLFIYSFDGRRRKQGLGSYPDVSLDRARQKAAESRTVVADGRDAVQAAEATKQARQQAELAARGRVTVSQLYSAWHASQIVPRHRDKGAEVARLLEKDVLAVIGDRYADEIRRADLMLIFDAVRKRGVKVTLNKLLQLLGQMFWYALVREIIQADPTAGIERKDAGGKAGERTRTLSEDEVRALSEKLVASGVIPSSRAAFWIMLSTCCRVGELVSARWEDFDLDAGTWTIPAAHAKNGREHLLHLSRFAKSHVLALKASPTSATWLFPNPQVNGPMWPNSLQRQFRDRQIKPENSKLRNAVPQSLAVLGGVWTCHDLRRTGATMMGELGVRPDVIERVLNHVEPRKLIRTYQRQELLPERKEALARLGERLEFLARKSAG